jgi:hypothetical protein
MARILNKVLMTVSGDPGTGTVTLASAVDGYLSFGQAGATNGSIVSYEILESSVGWEIGRGTYISSGTTISRDTVVLTSVGDQNKLSFTANAMVFIPVSADDLVESALSVIDNSLVRFDGTSGKSIQRSRIIEADTGEVTVANTVNATGFKVNGVDVISSSGFGRLSANNVWTAKNSFTRSVSFASLISPTQLSASQDNYNPTNLDTALGLILNATADISLTGIAGGYDGRLLFVINDSEATAASIIFSTDDTGSTAANRFSGLSNVVLRAGHSLLLIYDGTNSKWRIIYTPRASAAVVASASIEAAYVSPVHQHRHPGHPKFWGYVTVSGGTPTLQTSYNMTSITDAGVGQLTVTIATDFSSASWCPFVSGERASSLMTVANLRYFATQNSNQAAGSTLFECWDGTAGTAVRSDPSSWGFGGLGTQ